MTELIQISAAFTGSLCFAVLFHITGKKLLFIGMGGALSWGSYLALLSLLKDPIAALFFSSILISLLAELFARIFKTPVILLLAPMLIPLIPGGDLYYIMTYLIKGDRDNFSEHLLFVVKEALAIAFGIIVIASLVQIFLKILHFYRTRME